MARTKKTWQEKLAEGKAKPGLPKVFYCEGAKKRMVVPSVGEIEDMIARIPPGRLLTIQQMTDRLKAVHSVDIACPMTTGIFAWIIANAAEEQAAAQGDGSAPRPSSGKSAPRPAAGPAVVPWWRLLKTGGELNTKYPGGGATQRQRLEAEGHRVVAKGKGKKLVVADYEGSLHGLG